MGIAWKCNFNERVSESVEKCIWSLILLNSTMKFGQNSYSTNQTNITEIQSLNRIDHRDKW